MNFRLQGMLVNAKKKIILFAILWLVIIILGVAPFSASVTEASQSGAFSFEIFFEQLGKYITSPFSSFGVVFGAGYIGTFGKGILYFTIVYFIAV